MKSSKGPGLVPLEFFPVIFFIFPGRWVPALFKVEEDLSQAVLKTWVAVTWTQCVENFWDLFVLPSSKIGFKLAMIENFDFWIAKLQNLLKTEWVLACSCSLSSWEKLALSFKFQARCTHQCHWEIVLEDLGSNPRLGFLRFRSGKKLHLWCLYRQKSYSYVFNVVQSAKKWPMVRWTLKYHDGEEDSNDWQLF